MGLASQSEIDQAVIKAKQKLRDDEILDVLKGCSYGGPINMPYPYSGFNQIVEKGGDMKYGKTNA